MTDCYGCDDAREGRAVIRAHSCAGSGTFRAAEAYAADMVDELSQDWPRFHVDIHFQFRALDESMVRAKMTELVTSMLTDDLVENADFSIKEMVA